MYLPFFLYLEWSNQCVNGITPMTLTPRHTCRWEAQHHPTLIYQSGCTTEWQGHLHLVYMECVVSSPLSAELSSDFHPRQFQITSSPNLHNKRVAPLLVLVTVVVNIPVLAQSRINFEILMRFQMEKEEKPVKYSRLMLLPPNFFQKMVDVNWHLSSYVKVIK